MFDFLSKKWLKNGIFIGIICAVVLITVLYLFLWRAPIHQSEPEQFTVGASENIGEIATSLKNHGFIRSPKTFLFLHFITGNKKIESGGFLISKSMSVWQIVSILNKPVSLIWITIPPGLRKEEIADVLSKNLKWSQLEKQNFIAITNKKPDYFEGVYYPNTYLIRVTTTPEQAAARLTAHFQTVFAPYAQKALNKNIKWTTALTMASIIQREAAGTSDMSLIAGIFWNRLSKNMPLQVDATVQYARGNTGNGWWAPATHADLKIVSPYNTYLNKGLPPHPIDSPSLNAIAATLSPATTTCLYYIHDYNKIIHCATTFAGHKANIAKYLQ